MLSWVLVAIIVFSCLGLGGIVYFKDPKGKINKIFLTFVSFVAIWILSNYLQNEPIDPSLASLFLRIDFASAALLIYFFFLFAINFQRNYLFPSTYKQVLLFLPPCLFSILSFSDLIINRIGFENHVIYFEQGPLFPFYAVLIVGYVAVGCSDLFLKYKKLKGIEQKQTFYVLLGLFLSASIALVINLFFQHSLPIELFRIGNYAIFFFVGFTTYAIVARQLFDIRVILSEILVGAIAIILFIQTITADVPWLRVLNGGVFVLFCVFGYFLIRATIKEIAMRKEIERLSRAKSEFISIASHQLRTPLTAIKGYISMILEGTYGRLPEKIKKPMENVYKSNERLIKLINDLLNVSRIESGRMEMNLQRSSLSEIVSGCVEELRIQAENKNIGLNWQVPEALPQALIDPDKIRQVILNIIDNAIKYTERGEVRVGCRLADGKYRIIVSDTGAGMAEEEVSYLFESFSRGKAGTELCAEGAGLGLYVARKLIEMHSGKIWAESPGKGKGSTFYIELPIKIRI